MSVLGHGRERKPKVARKSAQSSSRTSVDDRHGRTGKRTPCRHPTDVAAAQISEKNGVSCCRFRGRRRTWQAVRCLVSRQRPGGSVGLLASCPPYGRFFHHKQGA